MNQRTRLIIARHGNTFGPEDAVRRVGITDLPLVESGLLQGLRLGDYLQQQQLIPDVIFTSQLQRTRQTADQIQRALDQEIPQQALALFNEIDYGPDENKVEAEVLTRLGDEVLQAWETQAIVPAGWKVDPNEIIANWHHFANQLRQEHLGTTVLVVTSNGIARFAPYLTGNFAEFALNHGIKLATGALSVFENDGISERWHCLEWNKKPAPIGAG